MSRHITTGSNPGANVLQDVYLERFVTALKKRTGVIHPLGRMGTLPKGSGKTIRWQFFNAPAAITTTVAAEGDDPADVNFTTTVVTAVLEEFGGVTPFSRLLASSALSGTVEQIVDLLGYQGGLSVEVRTISEVDGSTTSVNSGTAMTADALRQGAQVLVNNGASPNPATPGGAYFCFIGSSEACYDMIGEGAPTWVQAKSRDIEANLLLPLQDTPASSGVYGCIVKLSQSVQRDTTQTPDDDQNVLCAADGFGVADLDFSAMNPQVTVTPPDQYVVAPARNRGTAAWLLFYISKLIDSKRVVVILSDATGT